VVRKFFPDLLIGYSAHTMEEMRMAETNGADYVFISPVFSTAPAKSNLAPLGIDKVVAWKSGLKIPVFGLGGVTAENLNQLFVAGCAGAASISLFVENGEFSSKGMVV
jgi:thiamine-phosphate pyrophosphorylase